MNLFIYVENSRDFDDLMWRGFMGFCQECGTLVRVSCGSGNTFSGTLSDNGQSLKQRKDDLLCFIPKHVIMTSGKNKVITGNKLLKYILWMELFRTNVV